MQNDNLGGFSGGTDIPPTPPSDAQNNNSFITTPKKKGVNKKTLGIVIGIVFLLIGTVAGVILVGQQQDIREKADGDKTSGASLSKRSTPNPFGGNLGGGTGTKTTGSIGKEVDGVPNATGNPLGGNLGGGLSSSDSKGAQVGENSKLSSGSTSGSGSTNQTGGGGGGGSTNQSSGDNGGSSTTSTPSPTPTPTRTPTPTPSSTSSSSPTNSSSPSSSPSSTPPPVPSTGTGWVTVVTTLFGVLVVIGSIFLAL